MEKMMAVIGLVCLCNGVVLANGQDVDFDNRDGFSSIEPGILRTIQIEVPQAADPSVIAVEAGMKPQLLSDLLVGCSQRAKAEFYKSLFFANGGVASAKVETVRNCASQSALETITGARLKGDGFGKDGYECKCNSSNQLNCKREKDSTCEEVFCWGACTIKGRSEFGYADMTRVFDLLPKTVAEEFIGGFSIQAGKLKKISVTEPVLTGLGIEKVAQIMETVMR